jgi:hypothetical protein
MRVLEPGSYVASQAYARALRDDNAMGVVYPNGAAQAEHVSVPSGRAPSASPARGATGKTAGTGSGVDRSFEPRQDAGVAL